MSDVFSGEMMTCALCGKQEQSDPKVESNWRLIKMDKQAFYVCTDHFPADDAGKHAFTRAYTHVFSRLLEIVSRK